MMERETFQYDSACMWLGRELSSSEVHIALATTHLTLSIQTTHHHKSPKHLTGLLVYVVV